MKLRYLLLSLLLISHVSWAEGIAWQQLPPESQTTLGKYKDRWQNLPPAKQEAMAERARAWEQMPSEQRAEALQRFKTGKHYHLNNESYYKSVTNNLKNCHLKSRKR